MLTDNMISYGVLILVIFGPLGSLGQTCGGTLNKDSPTRNFTSPNYPDRLDNRVTCEWIIEAPMGQVQLQFEFFDFLIAFFGCADSGAFVSIYDGSSTSDPSLGRYCGDENGIYTPPDVIMSSSGSLLVNFYSGDFGGLLAGQGFVTTFSFPDYAECADVMCQNGGTCTDTPTGYSCSCAVGFTGLQCETDDVDHCASSPCTNGGTCMDRSDGFQCLCTPEYVGTQCQVAKSSCLLPLGMANGDIADSQISASTEKTGYEAYKGRLNGPRAWQPDVANTNQWLQVNFNNRTIITGIQTQGLWGGHVKSYRLFYGDTEDILSVYNEAGLDGSKVFDANSDGATVVSHDLDVPIVASIVRVNPQDFTNNLIRLRMELLGCEEPAPPTQPATTTPGTTTVQSTHIPTTHALTTEDVSTVPQTTPAPTTTHRSTTQPIVATTSTTVQTTLLSSTQSRTTEMPTTSLRQTTTDSTTAMSSTPLAMSSTTITTPGETSGTTSFTTLEISTVTTTSTSTASMVETSGTTAVPSPTTAAIAVASTTPMVETSGTTTVPSPTPAATTTTTSETTPMVETSGTTVVPTPTTAVITVASTTPMVQTSGTTTVPSPTPAATTTTSTTTPMVETSGTTAVPTPTTAATTVASTTPMVEKTESAKTTIATPTPVVTISATQTPMVETSAKVTTVKTSLHTTTTEMKTNTPLPVETTKPEPKKTTESLSTYTTAVKDGDKAEQSSDSGGGGNTAVFAAAGAAGGVAVLVGVGVTVFICRRRGRNSEACGVPMERLGESNMDPKTDNTGAEVAIGNPLYGAMDEPDKPGIAVNDSCA